MPWVRYDFCGTLAVGGEWTFQGLGFKKAGNAKRC